MSYSASLHLAHNTFQFWKILLAIALLHSFDGSLEDLKTWHYPTSSLEPLRMAPWRIHWFLLLLSIKSPSNKLCFHKNSLTDNIEDSFVVGWGVNQSAGQMLCTDLLQHMN